jgi:hypothetical protein
MLHRRRSLGVLLAALAPSACLVGSVRAAPAPNFCTTIGVTSAAAKKAFGPTVTPSVQPNPGEDLGICLVSRHGETYLGPYSPGAEVELYSPAMGPGLLPSYEHDATSKKPLAGLGKGAVLITGPVVSGITFGSPDVYLSSPDYFVTILGNPGYKAESGATAAQVIGLARSIYRKLG